jgi:SH3-like domain-containing protein
MIRQLFRLCLLVLGLMLLPQAASAQQREVPYWGSLASNEVNMRVGPSERYRIAWVYRREGMPVKVLRIQQGWWLIEEIDGTRGWVYSSLMSRQRMAMVTGEGPAAIREQAQAGARLLWNLEPGVIGKLGECEAGWCQIDVAGRTGWVEASRLWGTGDL